MEGELPSKLSPGCTPQVITLLPKASRDLQSSQGTGAATARERTQQNVAVGKAVLPEQS